MYSATVVDILRKEFNSYQSKKLEEFMGVAIL
jgi:hypothetical protein